MTAAPLRYLSEFVDQYHGINDKHELALLVSQQFDLVRDRSVFYGDDFAVRFSASNSAAFGNTVLSLSNLRKYDAKPFVVCVVTPSRNHLLLANSTLLKKISHSSQALRENNIRGSFNGSDILRDLDGIENSTQNLERLFRIHEPLGFEGNLPRLVESTNNISPSGKKFLIDTRFEEEILSAPGRAERFMVSAEATELKRDLDDKIDRYRNEILLAALIENVNVRGRIIEYLIAGEDDVLRQEIISAMKTKVRGLPPFKTDNALGDYLRVFDDYLTQTDVKTKVMLLDSNPKAYNIDKVLEFLSRPRSVFLFYFVGVDIGRIENTVLISMFQKKLLSSTILLRHWAGRNSRGVTQFEGRTIENLIRYPDNQIDTQASVEFLNKLMAL